MQAADVSVVIATRNRADLVEQAVASVLNQSQPVRELIVVDDGSVDDTRERLSKYGERVLVLSQQHGGASIARNRGVRAAQGEWIAFLDDDDVWLAGKIEQQMRLARQDPELGLVYCSDYAVDDELRPLYPRLAEPANRGDAFERLLVRNFVFTSCVIVRRRAVEEAGYMDPEMRFAQDWDLWLKVAARFPIGFVSEPLVLYRQSASGCLSKEIAFSDRLKEMEIILERALALRSVSPRVRRNARLQLELRWASGWLAEHRSARALAHSLRALLLGPRSMQVWQLIVYSAVPRRTREQAKRLFGT